MGETCAFRSYTGSLQCKVFEVTGKTTLCWLPGTSLAAEHVIGARVRLMEQVPAPVVTHAVNSDVVFVVGDTEFPAQKAVSILFGKLGAVYKQDLCWEVLKFLCLKIKLKKGSKEMM